VTIELRAPDTEAVAEVPRLLAAEGLSTRPPAPTLAQWVAEIGELLRNRIFGALGWVPDSGIVETVFFVLLVVGAALLIGFAISLLLRRRAAVPAAPGEGEELALPAPSAPLLGPAQWRARLERSLAAGDAAGALEALWSWLLSALAGESADVRAIAGRRLVRELGRADLLPLVHGLETASYGGRIPDLASLRDLANRVATATGAAP
jgi:hypothetical protein